MEIDEPVVLRPRAVPLGFLVMDLVLAAMVLVMAAFSPRGITGSLWLMVGLLLLVLGIPTALLAGQRIILADGVLTTRLVAKGPRIPAAEIREATVLSSSPFFTALMVERVGAEGPRHENLRMPGLRAESEHRAATITAWARAHGGAQPPEPVAVEEQGEVADQLLAHPRKTAKDLAFPLFLAAFGAALPLTLFWHPVPWWGWCGSVLLLLLALRWVMRMRLVQGVELRGDELLLVGSGRRIRATEIAHVLSLEGGESRTAPAVQLTDGSTVVLPLPDEDRSGSTANLIQRWARAHGGALGQEVGPVRRPHQVRDFLVCALWLLGMALVIGAVWRHGMAPFLGSSVYGVVTWIWALRTRVARDWSVPR